MSEQAAGGSGGHKPKVLTFSTVNISDIGIDLAGSSHMHYPPSVTTISVPCSSGIKPKWILHAIESGFDGVFIAADGTDCALVPDCTDRTAKIVEEAQRLLEEHGYEPARVKMAAICSVCAEAYVSLVGQFVDNLKELGAPTKSA